MSIDINTLRRQRIADVLRLLLPANPDYILSRDIMAIVDHGLPVRAQFVSAIELNRLLADIGLTRIERQQRVAWAVAEELLELFKADLRPHEPEARPAPAPVAAKPEPRKAATPAPTRRPQPTHQPVEPEFEPVGDPIFTRGVWS